jgi:hypothetical protein
MTFVTNGLPVHCRKTTVVAQRELALHEAAFAKTLPMSFVLTEPRQSQRAFQVAANAAKFPMKPLRPQPHNQNLREDGGRRGSPSSHHHHHSSEPDASALALQKRALTPSTMVVQRVPLAKRSHMDGVLHGLPGDRMPPTTTFQDAITYSDEMQAMNRDKDTSFHRKRDAYSEYVEARARFSKMHSVN